MATTTRPTRRPARHTVTQRRDARWLEELYERYHHRRFVRPDPLQFLYDYEDLRDRELVAFIASSLAYGNVTSMLHCISGVLEPLGPRPAESLHATSRAALRRRLRGFRYRFTTGTKLAGLLEALRAMQDRWGTLDAAFGRHAHADDETVLPALGGFVNELTRCAPCALTHLVPHPDGGSACKRLNLFLRWMVRCDAIDPGGWSGVRPDQLVMPLDTHVHRTALERRWTARKTASLRTALSITEMLRRFSPEDPLRYDFAITRPGIRGERDAAG